MQYLHSYWRMEYIEAPKSLSSGDNPFTAIPKASDDREVYIVWRGRHAYIVMNIYPYNGGHLLAVPYKEVGDLGDLLEEEQNYLMQTIVFAQTILKEALAPHGFNIGFNLGKAAGAGIPQHLHAHIIPRWDGDTNFMPIIGKTRVLSSCLETMWERLQDVLPSVQDKAPA